MWVEKIYRDGDLYDTVHWDDLDDFFYTIEQAAQADGDPEGNKQVYDNWKGWDGNRRSTHYFDATGRRWDLEFERVPSP